MNRIVDPELVKRFLLTHDWCVACGKPSSNAHHILQKGSPHFGDDVIGNLVALCGTGTMRCHGAFHGNPYEHKVDTFQRATHVGPVGLVERRDSEWVASRIGLHVARERPDILHYVLAKVGPSAGREFLRRAYYMEGV